MAPRLPLVVVSEHDYCNFLMLEGAKHHMDKLELGASKISQFAANFGFPSASKDSSLASPRSKFFERHFCVCVCVCVGVE